jgi:uncharacterized membrane protein
MTYVFILLRLVHVLGAIFWVGGSLMMTLFVGPAIAADPQGGRKVLQHLMTNGKVSAWLSAAAGASVLAGLILYWLDSDGFRSAWTTSSTGIGFGLGALFGLAGFVAGIMIGRNNKAMAELGAQIQGQPTPEQAAQMAAIRNSLQRLTPLNIAALAVAALLMATARYFLF